MQESYVDRVKTVANVTGEYTRHSKKCSTLLMYHDTVTFIKNLEIKTFYRILRA